MLKIMDIHAHTFYSNCGADSHEAIIEAAIAGGIDIFGISDHNYGIGDRLPQYAADIARMRVKYEGQIQLLTGIEIASVPGLGFDSPELLKDFDYCLLEHIDLEGSTVGMNVFSYRQGFPCKFGIAHTDLIGMARRQGEDPAAFLRRFAENDIFWEMNVNLDSIHAFREHAYWLRFMDSTEEQAIVKASGIRLSVGFDGHRVYDYKPQRVAAMNHFLYDNGFPMVEF